MAPAEQRQWPSIDLIEETGISRARCPSARFARRLGLRHVVRVGGDAVAEESGPDVRSPAACVAFFLEDEEARGLPDRKALAAPVERAARIGVDRAKRVEAAVREPRER